jgi:LEA14-like dessication related protein
MASSRSKWIGVRVPVVGLLILCGCAGLGQRLEAPQVKLADIQVKEVKALETVFEVQLRVFNTNDVALKIDGVECELELSGDSFAVGVSKTEIEIGAFESQIVPLLVYTSVIDMVRGVHNIQKNEQLAYELSGKLKLGGNSFPSVIPFSTEGSVSFKELMDNNRQK